MINIFTIGLMILMTAFSSLEGIDTMDSVETAVIQEMDKAMERDGNIKNYEIVINEDRTMLETYVLYDESQITNGMYDEMIIYMTFNSYGIVTNCEYYICDFDGNIYELKGLHLEEI